MPSDYQYLRYQEAIGVGQTLDIYNVCIGDGQSIQVAGDGSSHITVIAEGGPSPISGVDLSDSNSWVTLVDTDSGVIFRKYKLQITNTGTSVGHFSVCYSCDNMDQSPGM